MLNSFTIFPFEKILLAFFSKYQVQQVILSDHEVQTDLLTELDHLEFRFLDFRGLNLSKGKKTTCE